MIPVPARTNAFNSYAEYIMSWKYFAYLGNILLALKIDLIEISYALYTILNATPRSILQVLHFITIATNVNTPRKLQHRSMRGKSFNKNVKIAIEYNRYKSSS